MSARIHPKRSFAPLLTLTVAALASGALAVTPADPPPQRPAKTPISAAQVGEAQLRIDVIEHRLDAATRENLKGLQNSRHFGVAHSDFLRAADEFEQASSEATLLGRENPAAHVDALLQRARDGRVSALLNGASISLASANLHDAMGLVNQVLAIDPSSTEAMSMRERIELCANQQLYAGPFTGQLPIVVRPRRLAPMHRPPLQTPATWTASRAQRGR